MRRAPPVLLLLLTSLPGCVHRAPSWAQLTPPQASSSARAVDTAFGWEALILGLLMLLVIGLLTFFCVRYRAGSSASRRDRLDDPRRLEWTWLIATTLLFVALFGWSGYWFFQLELPPADAMRIDVVGKQWMWKVEHGNGRRELNELHVPTGRAVQLLLTSQDVIHSFYVPAFRLKHDVLPNRTTQLWFRAERPGRYDLFCAEYCGADHSLMTGRVVVMEPDAFARWLAAGAEPRGEPAGARGQPGVDVAHELRRGQGAFFRYGCGACHLAGGLTRAPRLDGLFGRPTRLRDDRTVIADEDYIRESILRPDARIVAGYPAPSLMPTYEGLIPPADVEELVAFIRSLREGWQPPEGEDGR